jgi:hypothetical protein
VSSVTRGVDPSFDFNIGKAHMRGADLALASALAAGEAAAARRTLEEAVAGEGFSDFLRAPERHGFHPVMLIEEALARRAGAKDRVVRLSAETLQNQRRLFPDIVEADYRSLPGVGFDPDLVIQDGGKTLFLIRQGDDWLVALVNASRAGKPADLTSLKRIDAREVEILRRRGRVILRRES